MSDNASVVAYPASGRHSIAQFVPDGFRRRPLDGTVLDLSGSLLHTRQEHPGG